MDLLDRYYFDQDEHEDEDVDEPWHESDDPGPQDPGPDLDELINEA